MEETFFLSIYFEPGFAETDFYTDRALSLELLPENGPYEVVKIKYIHQLDVDDVISIDFIKFRDVKKIYTWQD